LRDAALCRDAAAVKPAPTRQDHARSWRIEFKLDDRRSGGSKEEAMARSETKVPVTSTDAKPGAEEKPSAGPAAMQALRPFELLRREVDRLFEDFTLNPFRVPFRRPAFDLEPFWQAESWVAAPAIDLVERDNSFEMTAELPGLDEKNIDVNLANGVLTIKGQKEEEKAEKKEDFHLRERRYGSFVRSVRVPDMVDVDKIEASFRNGVLKVILPKKLEAQKPVKKIEVKGG
jgi:HSP20 family protein